MNEQDDLMKKCLSGKDCVTPGGPELPLGSFYANAIGGYSSRCKQCTIIRNNRWRKIEFREDAQSKIDVLKSITKNKRAFALLKMINEKIITEPTDFREVLEAVDFGGPTKKI